MVFSTHERVSRRWKASFHHRVSKLCPPRSSRANAKWVSRCHGIPKAAPLSDHHHPLLSLPHHQTTLHSPRPHPQSWPCRHFEKPKTRSPVRSRSPVPVDLWDTNETTPDRGFWGGPTNETTPDRGFWGGPTNETTPQWGFWGGPKNPGPVRVGPVRSRWPHLCNNFEIVSPCSYEPGVLILVQKSQ